MNRTIHDPCPIDEGKPVIKAVRDNPVVLQTGTQQRSSIRFRMACELVRNGRIGKLKQVVVYLPAGRREGPFASQPVSAELDWDFWQGQAPKNDYLSNDHMGNLFDCMRSRKDPICAVKIGHRSATVCHLGAISLRTGLNLQWNPDQEKFTGEHAAEGNAHVAREMRNPYDYSFVN